MPGPGSHACAGARPSACWSHRRVPSHRSEGAGQHAVPGRASGTARADVALAWARDRRAWSVVIDQRHLTTFSRAQHAAGDEPAQAIGGGSRRNTASSWASCPSSSRRRCTRSRSTRSSTPRWTATTSSITAISTSVSPWAARAGGAHPARCRPEAASPRSKEIAAFGVKARDGKLSLEDLTGGRSPISNGGTFGSMLSTPIINPPQSAILGVHATKDRPVGERPVVVRPMNYLGDDYDHRIIDGREAVLTLVAIWRGDGGPVAHPARTLTIEGRRRPRRCPSKHSIMKNFDVLVIGAGPAGYASPRFAPGNSAFDGCLRREVEEPKGEPRSAAPASMSAASLESPASNRRKTTRWCSTSSPTTASAIRTWLSTSNACWRARMPWWRRTPRASTPVPQNKVTAQGPWCFLGTADGGYRVEVAGDGPEEVRAKHVIIATGSKGAAPARHSGRQREDLRQRGRTVAARGAEAARPSSAPG